MRLVCFGDVHMAGAVTRLAGEIDTADAAIRVGHLTDWAGREDEASDACVQVAEQQPGPCGRQTRDRGQARRSAMLATRTLLAVALAIAVPLVPALAENPVAPAPDAQAAAPDATGTPVQGQPHGNPPPGAGGTGSSGAAGSAAQVPPSYLGEFRTGVLAGEAINELRVPVQSTLLPDLPRGTIAWTPESPPAPIAVFAKTADTDKTVLSVPIPPPPRWWPPVQWARITIMGNVVAADRSRTSSEALFDGTVRVGVLWFPFLVTALAIATIYPGCAMVVGFVRRRHYKKDVLEATSKGQPSPAAPPSFLATLDPVQITANAYGRASLAKLQIFLFTMIVFGILLFYQLRSGVLAKMSSDVLLLLGISAVGAAGGKITYAAKRRLSLENWAWLRRKGWLPAGRDVAQRAQWSELFLDSDTKEFDPYSFQMALFSLVVAVALLRTDPTSLGTFQVPPELLALLGISQAVFIGGKAIEKSGYGELDTKLADLRDHEAKFQQASVRGDKAKADEERQAFKATATQTAEIFWAIYGEQLQEMPPALASASTMEPDLH